MTGHEDKVEPLLRKLALVGLNDPGAVSVLEHALDEAEQHGRESEREKVIELIRERADLDESEIEALADLISE
jgi:hypothetical protein